MKKLITAGVSLIWIASMILSSCTKTTLADPQQTYPADKSFKDPGPGAPVYNYGTLKGVLSPVPYFAKIKIDNGKGFISWMTVPENGAFKINTLPEDVYDMQIAYTIQRGEFFYTLYHDITNVSMKDGELTDLGIIYLPWTY